METGKPAQKFLEAYIKVNLVSVLLTIIANKFTGLLGALTVFLISIHLLPFLIYYAGLKQFNIFLVASKSWKLVDQRITFERNRF